LKIEIENLTQRYVDYKEDKSRWYAKSNGAISSLAKFDNNYPEAIDYFPTLLRTQTSSCLSPNRRRDYLKNFSNCENSIEYRILEIRN
jgi:hypothetical protein